MICWAHLVFMFSKMPGACAHAYHLHFSYPMWEAINKKNVQISYAWIDRKQFTFHIKLKNTMYYFIRERAHALVISLILYSSQVCHIHGVFPLERDAAEMIRVSWSKTWMIFMGGERGRVWLDCPSHVCLVWWIIWLAWRLGVKPICVLIKLFVIDTDKCSPFVHLEQTMF